MSLTQHFLVESLNGLLNSNNQPPLTFIGTQCAKFCDKTLPALFYFTLTYFVF